MCRTWPLVKHEKQVLFKFWIYYCIQHAKSAPFKMIKNCHSFITISQSSVLTNDCDHTMKLFFFFLCYEHDWTQHWTKSGECVDSNLNTSDWPLHSRFEQTCLWLATLLTLAKMHCWRFPKQKGRDTGLFAKSILLCYYYEENRS